MSVETLQQTRLFAGVADAALAQLAERAIERSYEKGQIIFHQGDSADSLFVVVEGSVKVFVTSERGDEMVLVTLRPHDTFGELGLIDGGPRSASTETLERTRVYILTRSAVLQLLREIPDLLDTLLRSLGASLRRLTEQASDFVFLDLHGRTAKLLLQLAETRGERLGDEIVLDLGMTQSDLAAMVGGSRQSVNQILHYFEERGYLELGRRRVVIKKPDLLRKRAS